MRIYFVLAAAATLVGSLWLSYQLRFDFAVPPEVERVALLASLWVVSIKLFGLWRFRQFQVLLRYFGLSDFSGLFWALFTTSLFVYGISSHLGWSYAPPRSVVVADFSFSLIGLTALRFALRRVLGGRTAAEQDSPHRRARRAGIIGAGLVGTTLAQEFANRRELGLQAVAFFDDDRSKWGHRIQDTLVVGPPEALLNDQHNLELEEVIIAMPNASATRVAEIARTLHKLQVKFSTVPTAYELTTGRASVSQLRAVNVQDLLGREQVQLRNENVRHLLHEQVVMVTGAGGSIGSELCRQIAAYSPRTLLLVEQSEVQLFQIEQNLVESGHGKRIVPLLANILDSRRMEAIFQIHRPQIVFHAAAHKHVPMTETQPGEALKNNALGTLSLAEACVDYQVRRFVLISSDKAINPTNVMGATKRLAEMCVQSLHAHCPDTTRFMAVRFGNVLGSSGSVVPTFNKQIAAGGPVTVTHPEVMRYFMTIPEAVGLVLQSAALGAGGEIFTLDMGEPVKIVDLARQLIRLSGFTPDKDIRIEFTGLRPGEKLFEELSYQGEHIVPTSNPKIMRLLCEPPPFQEVKDSVLALVEQIDVTTVDEFKGLLQQIVPEYQPQLGKATYPKHANADAFAGARGRHCRPIGEPIFQLEQREAA
ncbi:MAG TPA: nucleoside-diphosphate sugar epimerase/dehydratase [Candidatus Paceibacterota bacterium]|nr:nucleoside-diphosphate sugar epimerase/dehydratase [Verrucomicrobiota bacterium]HSA08834.1 nucleoside-diphosphate sugar epimerase/dehydratase [Candidatus Paceibacterota bacterium]